MFGLIPPNPPPEPEPEKAKPKMPKDVEDPQPLEGEQLTIYMWRLHEFERAGYPDNVARKLARSRADIQVVRELAGKCPPHLVTKLLA